MKNLPAMQETQVQFLGWEDPLEKEMATHSSILAWRIPWTEKPGIRGVTRVGHNLVTKPPPVLRYSLRSRQLAGCHEPGFQVPSGEMLRIAESEFSLSQQGPGCVCVCVGGQLSVLALSRSSV